MKKEMQNYTQNRELSWLKFNQRVLEEAKDSSVPLLERMKFVSIFTSNLDEFFMIRVGSLYDMSLTDNSTIDSRSGMNPKEQLDAIFAAVAPLYKERDKTYSEIKKLLNPYGVCGLSIKELEQQEKKYVKKYFKDQILPILSPQIVDANHPFPHLLNKELYVIASLKQNGTSMIGIVPVPQFVSDILYLPGHDIRYIRMEKVIMEYLDVVFDKYEVSNKNYICVTRNADVSPDDEALEINDDFRLLMQETLHKRRRMAVVRMETAEPLDKELEKYFCDKFKITPAQIYRTKMPMKLEAEVRLHDPYEALDGKEDGLYFYRILAEKIPEYLTDGGWLVMEIGYDQSADVEKLLKETGFEQVSTQKDLAGLDRVVCGVYNRRSK